MNFIFDFIDVLYFFALSHHIGRSLEKLARNTRDIVDLWIFVTGPGNGRPWESQSLERFAIQIDITGSVSIDMELPEAKGTKVRFKCFVR